MSEYDGCTENPYLVEDPNLVEDQDFCPSGWYFSRIGDVIVFMPKSTKTSLSIPSCWHINQDVQQHAA